MRISDFLIRSKSDHARASEEGRLVLLASTRVRLHPPLDIRSPLTAAPSKNTLPAALLHTSISLCVTEPCPQP